MFGIHPGGEPVEIVTLTNRWGLRARVLNLGAALHSMTAPDRDGKFEDLVLDYPDLEAMIAKPQYFGATVGRFANRIARGKFVINGREHTVPTNDGGNSLHGGPVGFDKALWEIVRTRPGQVTLKHLSPDGDQGYPGALVTTAVYTLDDDNRLSIEYHAVTDRPTIVNLTNHTYWNLAGEGAGSAMEQELLIAAEAYTPSDLANIPTGEIRPVADTAFDFRQARPISCDLRRDGEPQTAATTGYDHNWVIGLESSQHPRLAAMAWDRKSGRTLTLLSTQPGLHFYTANHFDGSAIGKSGRAYLRGDGFALEPQHFPDAPNHPAFPSTLLEPGQEYRSRMVYSFSTDARGSVPCP